MHLSFRASPKIAGDWIFLEMLRDPSKKWRVDMYGQAKGEGKWLPLFSRVVGLADHASDLEDVSSGAIRTDRPAPVAEPRVMAN